jgi:D-psicose/D-tagatose/L-ribulose 3-epimerase
LRVAISNIAWDVAEDERVAELLQSHGICAIDVAPGKYFSPVSPPSDGDIARVRRWWAARGFEITGMQALLFGTTGLNLFGPSEVQAAMLHHLEGVCRFAAGLGCTKLVFGSPKNRDRRALTDADAHAVALDFFERLGGVAQRFGVTVCLEPNPPRYGANFLTTSAETAAFVKRLDHAAIRMQFDSGALTLSGEAPGPLLAQSHALIGHIHASEPDLLPIGDGGCDHVQMAAALREYLGDALVVIEMLASQNEPHLAAIERALAVAVQHYREPGSSEGTS